MRQSLQLRMGQQLTMTPQLQQAIRLLQLSTLDLQQEIQEALDSNPLLEIEEADYSEDAAGKNEQKADTDDITVSASADDAPSEYEQDSGEALAKEQGIKFYYQDFREYWKEGIELSKAQDMYRQQYCGCIYSEKDRYLGKTK